MELKLRSLFSFMSFFLVSCSHSGQPSIYCEYIDVPSGQESDFLDSMQAFARSANLISAGASSASEIFEYEAGVGAMAVSTAVPVGRAKVTIVQTDDPSRSEALISQYIIHSQTQIADRWDVHECRPSNY